MVKEKVRKGIRFAAMKAPHFLRFLDGGHAPYRLSNGSRAIASARWLNVQGHICVVDGPAFEDLATLRVAWAEHKETIQDPALSSLVFDLVAYGDRDEFSDGAARSPYLLEQLEQLPLPLRAELENFIKLPR